MNSEVNYLINQIIENEDYNRERLKEFILNHPDDNIKPLLIHEMYDDFDLLIKYLKSFSKIEFILDETCNSYKNFIRIFLEGKKSSILKFEVFSYIAKNDYRYIDKGWEKTDANTIYNVLSNPMDFELFLNDIYKALTYLLDENQIELVPNKVIYRPGGPGYKRMKRYCLSDIGIQKLVNFLILEIEEDLTLLLQH